MPNRIETITVLGAGSWGTALAALMAENGLPTLLWGRDADCIASINQRHENKHYLPGHVLPKQLQATTQFEPAVSSADCLLVAMPSHAFSETIRRLAPLRRQNAGVVWATKGFEPGSGRFLHDVAREVLGETAPLAVITGPSFALEVVQGLPTAVTVHGNDMAFSQRIASIMHGPKFRVYTGADMLGAELGGAMKNVLAVAVGVADGMQLGHNARAGLITRGLNEMLRLAAVIGARSETLMGLAGLGDLVLTCTGDLSRNRTLGLALGQGRRLKEAIADIGQVVESVQTVNEVMRLAERYTINLPISQAVHAVLHEQMTAEQALHELLSREQKPEYSVWP